MSGMEVGSRMKHILFSAEDASTCKTKDCKPGTVALFFIKISMVVCLTHCRGAVEKQVL